MQKLLKLLGVNLEVYNKQSPAEQAKVKIMISGLILSPVISGLVFGVFIDLLFQNTLFGLVAGLSFGTIMFFFDTSLLEPVKDRTLYIRFGVSLMLGLVFSLGVKFWVFEDTLESEVVKETELYNTQAYQDRVTDFEEQLLRKEQRLQDELVVLGKLQKNTRRIDEYQQRIDKERQLDALRESNLHLLEQRKETVSSYYKEAETAPLQLFTYMLEKLLGNKGGGYDWFLNVIIFLMAFALEAWAFIGAIILRGGDYMAEMEMIKLDREAERMRRIDLSSKMRRKTHAMDDAIMNDNKSVAEIRRDIVLMALKKEYTALYDKKQQTAEDRQRLQVILTELEELSEEDATKVTYESEEDALKRTLDDIKKPKKKDDDEMPPEFTYAT